jgi:hypothetical protein
MELGDKMPGTTNFLQWNPGANNQETDMAYAADSQRTGGSPVGVPFPSPTSNKLFYQLSTFVTAFAASLTNKNYSPNDSSIGALEAVLANIVTFNDLKSNLTSVAFSTSPMFDASSTNGFDFVMAGNVTSSTLTGQQIGQTLIFVIVQGSAPYTFSPPPNINGWVAISAVPNSVNVQSFIVREDGTIWPINTEINALVAQLNALQTQLNTLLSAKPVGSVLVSNGTTFVSKLLTGASASKIFGQQYQNTSEAEMTVCVTGNQGSAGGSMTALIGPGSANLTVVGQARVPAASSDPVEHVGLTFKVPPLWYYEVAVFNLNLETWFEYKYV